MNLFFKLTNKLHQILLRTQHPLQECLHAAKIRVLGRPGGTDYEDMRLFALERGPELSDMLSLPNGVPSEDTFERVFQRINPSEPEYSLRSYGKYILNDLAEKQIVIDGKKQRGTSPTSRGNKGLYILNARVSENRFCPAQEKVEDKSNEITDSVVSIDAAGTQRHIAEQIIQGGGHYLLVVKENQGFLYEDIECAFKVNSGTDTFEEVDAGHGRIETRKCSILPAGDYLMDETLALWKNLSTIVRIYTIRQQGRRIKYITIM